MSGLHVTVSTSGSFAVSLIGYTTGLLLTALLLVLTLRASKLPGTPLANIAFALCGICWSAGGLASAGLLAAGHSKESLFALVAQALQYTGAAAFPIPILAIWRPFALRPWQQRTARLLQIGSWITAAAITILLWLAPLAGAARLPRSGVWQLTACNAAVFIVLGAATSLRRDSTLRGVYSPSLAIVATVCAAAIASALATQDRGWVGMSLAFLASHLVILVLILAFLLFARFRYADIFIRYGIRILLAGFWAMLLFFTAISGPVIHIAQQSHSPAAMHVFAVILLANFFLLSFTFIDDRLTAAATRWLFHEPDYRAALRALAARLRDVRTEPEVAAAFEHGVCAPLELNSARCLPLQDAGMLDIPAALLEGEIVELNHARVLVPVAPAGRVTYVLIVAPGAGRPALVMQDLNYLRAAAVQAGNRLDALRRESEAAERESREAVLQQQVSEAELRALRAQINPHFLFNSLNTIADLVVRDAARAETMTLRLAGVFRHVLANSSRPLTSIRDEIEFLRTYLYIEEVRFGDRLRVEIEMAPEVAGEEIPSLILQPLVENALKHGLAPRPGPGRLWISARADGAEICLCVEDDGVGLAATRSGLGLTNVTERLATLYQDRAALTLEPREGGGARATIRIPRSIS